MQRQCCYFTGRVQGVGFRYTVQNLAQCHDVAGFVRNLPDGRVELVMEGPEGDMSMLIQDISRKMNGYIKNVSVLSAPPTGEFGDFRIRR